MTTLKRALGGAMPPCNPCLNRQVSIPAVTSYETPARKVKQPLRVHYPNLSPTRVPEVEADVALWPGWTKLSVEDLDLDMFDDYGNPLFPERGC
jgi:hypothetical protein